MDRFFGCVSTLMAKHLRMVVELSLNDLVAFMERYSAGNAYSGITDVPLPVLGQPIIINLVSPSHVNVKRLPKRLPPIQRFSIFS